MGLSLGGGLQGINRHARDQLLRASQSILLNLADGNGKCTAPDRRRFFEIARGSALECAAIQDILVSCKVIDDAESAMGKTLLASTSVQNQFPVEHKNAGMGRFFGIGIGVGIGVEPASVLNSIRARPVLP